MDYRWQAVLFDELTPHELYAFLRLRQQVFSVEQNCIYVDLDGRDQQAVHILCWDGDQLLCYQRCLPPGVSYPESSLGRIVVAAAARGLGLGRELVRRGISHNLQQWPGNSIRINAQAYLGDFYGGLGFRAEGEVYDEDGIPHQEMLLVQCPI